MATIFGDVQYTQNGTFNKPCKCYWKIPHQTQTDRLLEDTGGIYRNMWFHTEFI